MDINFELYKIFYFTAKYKSFSEAASKLYISQSAVSQAIKNLEKQLGEQLFYRKTRNIKLTSEGEVLFSHVEQAYNFLKAGESKICEMKNMNSGKVRLGVGDTICKYFLIPFLHEFNRTYPNIKIQVVNRTSSQIISALLNGIIDVGIATTPVNDNNIDVKHFKYVEDIFIASYKYKELYNKRVDIATLARYPLLMLERNTSTRRFIDKFLKENNISLVPEIELESVELLVEFAKIGLGISHVLKESAAQAISNNEVFEIKTRQPLPKRELGIVTVKGVPLSRSAKEFINMLCLHEGLSPLF